MECTPKWTGRQIGSWLRVRLHTLAVVGLVGLVWLGQPLESSLGWVACPPQVAGWAGAVEPRKDVWQKKEPGVDVRVGWEQGRRTWVRALARSELPWR